MTHLLMINSQKALHKHLKTYKDKQKSIALVPTMGALHAGHAKLIEKARKKADVVVVSVFVNPKQFGANEDLSRYPKPIEQDKALLESLKVDVLYHPDASEMYPANFSTVVNVHGPAHGLEGVTRPTHFEGVATVVLKLFMQIMPNYAYFGEKDFQQLAVINKMVEDLNLPVKIVGVPTVRDKNGLALSSRNQYLNEHDIKRAAGLNKALLAVAELLGKHTSVEEAYGMGRKILDLHDMQLDYIQAVDPQTLKPIKSSAQRPVRILGAAFINTVRLIDNIELK